MAIVKKKSIKKKPLAKKTAAKKSAKPAPKKKATAKKPVALKKKVVARKPVALKKKAATKKTTAQKPTGPLGIPEQLRDAALKVLDERQAEDIVTVPLAGRSSVADYMIIATGRAGRQISAIADYLREAFFKLGIKNIRIEGKSEGNWVLIDAGDIIVHLFRAEVRTYYDLDAIWKKSAK